MIIKTSRTISIEELEAIEQTGKKTEKKREENRKKTSEKIDKFHLPVLRLNDATEWPSLPKEERKLLTDDLSTTTCVGNCCGINGLKSSCCKIDPYALEHLLGPVTETCIKNIIKHFKSKNIHYKREDIVIDYEEGKLIGQKFFNGHEVFNSASSYPILRFQISGPYFSCKFLSDTGFCTIYHSRPTMCRDYLCEYILTNFLVKTKNHPNRYEKIK